MKSKLMLFGLMLCGVWSEMNAQDTVFRGCRKQWYGFHKNRC